jgi:2-polyprenyl-6-methoxyphenol hydroxylase-like FAD-dependent oxidoreductase
MSILKGPEISVLSRSRSPEEEKHGKAALGDHAVVLGAGLAGIMAAGVAARYFCRVSVIEKDELATQPTPRKGVPQSEQAHGILAYGEQAMERILPGYRSAMEAAGAVRLRYGRDVLSHDGGTWQPVRDLGSDLEVFFSTRPLMEHTARGRLSDFENVTITPAVRVVGMQAPADGRPGQIELFRDHGSNDEIECDLVIDCRGRGSRLPNWLKENGFGVVETEKVGSGIGYASGLFRTSNAYSQRQNAFRIQPVPPKVRGCIMIPVENDCWLAMLFGRFGDFAPTDEGGFKAFARTLDDTIIDDCIGGAQLCRPIKSYRVMQAIWRRYERMARFPEGILPLGDAIASFNPIHAQGISVAAFHANALWDDLEMRSTNKRNLDGLAKTYLNRAEVGTKIAWDIASTVDFAYDEVSGNRPADLPERLRRADDIRRMVQVDVEAQRLALRVKHLLDPPSVLDALPTHGVPLFRMAG